MFHIVLVEPEIPPNTGNIARTCAATGVFLHLVKPLGFSLDEKRVKRAGLDYWPYVNLTIHESLEAFLDEHKDDSLYFATTKSSRNYTEVSYEPGCYILFGKETKGLPESLIKSNSERAIRIPMGNSEKLRSLNLSNAAAVVLYEAFRQHDFTGLY